MIILTTFLNIAAHIVRDSVIQCFEYTYELGWKLLQRWIKLNVEPEEAEPRTKKHLFRLVAKKMINNPSLWFEFNETRSPLINNEKIKNMFMILPSNFYQRLKLRLKN
nr:nucleotidyltransferase substrate binding protein [Coxiella-like endosymbiont of Rhipicephalus sanguineus]